MPSQGTAFKRRKTAHPTVAIAPKKQLVKKTAKGATMQKVAAPPKDEPEDSTSGSGSEDHDDDDDEDDEVKEVVRKAESTEEVSKKDGVNAAAKPRVTKTFKDLVLWFSNYLNETVYLTTTF